MAAASWGGCRRSWIVFVFGWMGVGCWSVVRAWRWGRGRLGSVCYLFLGCSSPPLWGSIVIVIGFVPSRRGDWPGQGCGLDCRCRQRRCCCSRCECRCCGVECRLLYIVAGRSAPCTDSRSPVPFVAHWRCVRPPCARVVAESSLIGHLVRREMPVARSDSDARQPFRQLGKNMSLRSGGTACHYDHDCWHCHHST